MRYRIIRFIGPDPKILFLKFLNLIEHSDADFVGDKNDRKSTSGSCQFLGKSVISWHSKKQTFVALSTMKSEYLVIGSCGTQIILMMHQS